jgi:hypothetical protein
MKFFGQDRAKASQNASQSVGAEETFSPKRKASLEQRKALSYQAFGLD